MGLFKSIAHLAHGIKHDVRVAGTGLYKGVARPTYKAAIRPVAVATVKVAKKYGGKAQDFVDANIDTAIGMQKALTRATQSVADVGEGLGSFLENGFSWYLVLGGGALVALVVLTR